MLVQPDDQNFDVNLVARHPENLVEVEMVKVRPGEEDRFQQLRAAYVTRARNSRHVLDVVTFHVVNGVLESLPEDNLFNFDSSNNEFTLTFYASEEERRAALEEDDLKKDDEIVTTYDCIVCAVINTDLDPTYYPPFPEDP